MIKTITVGALALVCLGPVAAQAQTGVRADIAVEAARADLLTEQAYLAAGQASDFSRAASWLRDAAALRGENPEAVRALMDAGHFHYYAQRSGDAVSAFHQAGKVALNLGDAETAARAFRNAAFAAHRIGDVDTARRFMARSETLEAERAVAQATVVAQDR